MKINRVRSPAKLADAVPVLLALGLARYLGLHAVEPLALIVAVEGLAADQRLDPCGAIVGGRDDTSGRRGVGRVLLGAVIGLEGSGFDRGLDVGRVRLVRQITKGAAAVQVAMRVRLWECVRRDGGEHCVLQTQRSEQSVVHDLRERFPVDLFRNEAEQRVVSVGVVKVRTGREVGRMRERDCQHLGWRPDLGRVTLEDCPERRVVVVSVKTTAHIQQFTDGDLVAIGHIRDVIRNGIVKPELVFLGE